MHHRSLTLAALALLALGTGLQAASTIYLATSLGPYKSTDGGATFTQLVVKVSNPFLPSQPPHVNGLAVDPILPRSILPLRDSTNHPMRAKRGRPWCRWVSLWGRSLQEAHSRLIP